MKNAGPILLIEDDPEDQLLIKEALEYLKVDRELVIKNNGQEAFEYLTTMQGQPFQYATHHWLTTARSAAFKCRASQKKYSIRVSINRSQSR